MSRPERRRRTSKSGRAEVIKSRARRDAGVYGMFVLVGAFIMLLSVPLLGNLYLGVVGLGYLCIVSWLVCAATFRAVKGNSLPGWQRALARVPLRFVGYVGRDARPLEAASHDPRARTALLVTVLFTVLLIASLVVLALPRLLEPA